RGESRLFDVDSSNPIRMGREAALDAQELGLRLAVLRCCVPAPRTLAAGVLGRHRYQKTALPLRLVLQLTAQFEQACVANRTVESRLRANPLSRLCLRAPGGGKHVLYCKVFDKHDGVVLDCCAARREGTLWKP